MNTVDHILRRIGHSYLIAYVSGLLTAFLLHPDGLALLAVGLVVGAVAARLWWPRRSNRAETLTPEERRKEEMHRVKLRAEQAKVHDIRTRVQHRRRTKAEQEQAEKKAYIRGATDQASR